MLWVKLSGGGRTYQFFRAEESAPTALDKKYIRGDYLLSVTNLFSEANGELPNMTIVLSNRDRFFFKEFLSQPPLYYSVEVHAASKMIFSGTVQSVSMSAINCSLGVEA